MEGEGKNETGDFGPGLDPYALDRVTIGELDLAALCRAYGIIRIFFSMPRKNRGRENNDGREALRRRIAEYLLWEGPGKNERELALRMVFEEELEAPRRRAIAAKMYGKRLGLEEDEKQKEEHAPERLRHIRDVIG